MMKKKLGLFGDKPNDEKIIENLLKWMFVNKADYTNTFCFLMKENIKDNEVYKNETFLEWQKEWHQRLKHNTKNFDESLKMMKEMNPLVIPRNEKVEEALTSASNNEFNKFNKLLKILSTPYENQNGIVDYQKPSKYIDGKYQTFCGT